MTKLVLLVMVLGLAACNTIDGVGKDISATAQNVQDSI